MAKSTSATIIADQTVIPEDEFFHQVEGDQSWSESYYFYYFDPAQNIGGITRMGFRANDGWADYMHIVFLEGRRIVFCYERRDLGAGDTDLTVGGLTLVRGEPFDEWTILFDGDGSDLPDGKILTTPRRDRPRGWDVRNHVTMRIDFKRLADPHYMIRSENRAHFEQVGTAAGYIEVDGRRREFSGFGLRDKSWGPRPWSDTSKGAPKLIKTPLATGAAEGLFNLWITSVINENLGFALAVSQDPRGGLHSMGFLYSGGQYFNSTVIEVESSFEKGTVFHTGNRFHAVFENGHELTATGTVLSLGPSKVPQPGGATLVNSAMTRYQLSTGETGLGSAEYWISVRR